MKTFTLAELEKLELKDIDIETCFTDPETQKAFIEFCSIYPNARDLLAEFCRMAFIEGMRAMNNALREKLHA